MEQKCFNCRHREKTVLESPCNTGVFQMKYAKRCYHWKPIAWWQKVSDWFKKR